jgi:hypothetical protein
VSKILQFLVTRFQSLKWDSDYEQVRPDGEEECITDGARSVTQIMLLTVISYGITDTNCSGKIL